MTEQNTVVSACDQAYAWGVWLLIASMRKSGMSQPILIGAYNWQEQWRRDIEKFPNVKVVELPIEDRRSVTCSKPKIMCEAQTDYITWVDCDGFFTADCTEQLTGAEDEIYLRPRTSGEVRDLYRRERRPADQPNAIPGGILDVWQLDVGERAKPRYEHGISAALISVHRKNLPFIKRWSEQMQKVLPADVSVVDAKSIAYFQTDESVLNSLLLFADDAPPITRSYLADKTDGAHYIHFAFNPKPWIMWNRYSLRHYDATLDVVEWAIAAGYAPNAALPFPFQRKNRRAAFFLARFDRLVSRWRKLKKKLAR